MFSHVIELFPTPVLFAHYPHEFTAQEEQIFNSVVWTKNIGNLRSADSHLLHHPDLAKIHTFLIELMTSYIEEVFEPKYTVTPYITQSWLNKTERGQYHHMHNHPNSFLSGVLYLETHQDSITFFQPDRKLYTLMPRTTTNHNAEQCGFSPSAKEIILFPSYLQHRVEMKQTDGNRISLAFNALLHGTVGSESALTEAIL